MKLAKWAKGPVVWTENDQAFISVVFTWDMERVLHVAEGLHNLGYQVHVGGPGVFVKTAPRTILEQFATVGGDHPDAVQRHNPMATFSSRGCPVGCWFCIVPAMEGKGFTLIDDFPVRPILCDNNLSALPPEWQDHVVARYQATGVPLLDANSGFEPRTFDVEVYERWAPINRGPWRFACDDEGDAPHVWRTLEMLRERVPNPRRKRVYTLIGNEPVADCMDRVLKVIELGGEPHAQPLMKLNAPAKRPWIRHDWTEELLRDVARWTNRRLWKYCRFDEYRKHLRSAPPTDQNQTALPILEKVTDDG